MFHDRLGLLEYAFRHGSQFLLSDLVTHLLERAHASKFALDLPEWHSSWQWWFWVDTGSSWLKCAAVMLKAFPLESHPDRYRIVRLAHIPSLDLVLLFEQHRLLPGSYTRGPWVHGETRILPRHLSVLLIDPFTATSSGRGVQRHVRDWSALNNYARKILQVHQIYQRIQTDDAVIEMHLAWPTKSSYEVCITHKLPDSRPLSCWVPFDSYEPRYISSFDELRYIWESSKEQCEGILSGLNEDQDYADQITSRMQNL